MEKYFSPPSGATVRIFLSVPYFLASLRAAATLAPEEMPMRMPRLADTSTVAAMASSSLMVRISSTTLPS